MNQTNSSLTTAPPQITASAAARLAAEHFGLFGTLTRLTSERDLNFRIEGPQGARVRMEGRGDVIVLSSNNYLGLANEAAVVDAGIAGLQRFGAGTAAPKTDRGRRPEGLPPVLPSGDPGPGSVRLARRAGTDRIVCRPQACGDEAGGRRNADVTAAILPSAHEPGCPGRRKRAENATDPRLAPRSCDRQRGDEDTVAVYHRFMKYGIPYLRSL